jgi:LEA14-like dessication related protein
MSKKLKILGAALLAVTAPACAVFFRNPLVTIADVRVVSVGLTGATAQVALDVANPNGFDLTAEEVRYRLSYADEAAEDGWRTLAQGQSDERLVITANRTTQVRLNLPFTYAGVGRALENLLSVGSLPYRLDGDVKFETPVRDVRVSFDRRGSLAP